MADGDEGLGRQLVMVRLRENQVPQNTPITNENNTIVVA